jgi:segregation and condensation protein A
VDVTATSASPFVARDTDFLVVDLDRFQGPLDLLLHLIRTQDIDVFDIPIARITDQFLRAVKAIDASQLDHAGEFLEMAASLVRIKAQMLLPRYGDDEDLDPRAELVRRLLEYEQIREIAQRLERAEADRARLFTKGYVEPRPRPALADSPLETTWHEVLAAAMGVEMPERADHGHRVSLRPVAMEDKVTLIMERLREVARIEFSRLLIGLEGFEAKMHGVMTLLASLEMTRRRDVFLRQVEPFTELWVYRRDDDEADEGGGDTVPGVEGDHAAGPGEPGADPTAVSGVAP